MDSRTRKMFSQWFPFPSGSLLYTINKKKRQIKDQQPIRKSSDDESSDESSESKKQKSSSMDSDYDYSSDYNVRLDSPITGKPELESELVEIQKGGHLDVVSFLSNNGKTTHLVRSNGETVNIDVLRGKYVLICCFKLPVYRGSYGYSVCRSLIDAYSDLRRDLFEIVLVVDKEPSLHLRKDVFGAFFSAFQCLAVPFADFDTRHFICSSIGLKFSIGTILVGPEGDIMQHHEAYKNFNSYGSAWFPFTDDYVERLETQDDILRIRLDPFYRKRNNRVSPRAAAIIDSYHQQPQPPSLHSDILLCDWSLVLHRVDPDAGPSMTVSQLRNKHIGLYLCCDGGFMDKLNEVHKQCLAMNQELEIVVVCLPLSDHQKAYHRNLLEALKLFNITSWFVFPFEENRKACRRLSRVFVQYPKHDKLVILPPYNSGQPGEIEARALISQFGMNIYPFTATKIVDQRYNALKSLNPVSWFIYTGNKKNTCLIRNGSDYYVRKSKLNGKKLLLYLDWLQFDVDNGEFCRLLMKHYPEIKASGCEVVFVPLNKEYIPIRQQHATIAAMPWPIMPVQPAGKPSVTAQLILPGDNDGYNPQLIALGADGKILSKRAHLKLIEGGVTESLFADTLYQEVVQDLTDLNPCDYLKS